MRGILNEAQPGVSRNTGGRAPGALKQSCVTVKEGWQGWREEGWKGGRVEEGFCVPVLLSRKLERGQCRQKHLQQAPQAS